jgi:hypothetical protein
MSKRECVVLRKTDRGLALSGVAWAIAAAAARVSDEFRIFFSETPDFMDVLGKLREQDVVSVPGLLLLELEEPQSKSLSFFKYAKDAGCEVLRLPHERRTLNLLLANSMPKEFNAKEKLEISGRPITVTEAKRLLVMIEFLARSRNCQKLQGLQCEYRQFLDSASAWSDFLTELFLLSTKTDCTESQVERYVSNVAQGNWRLAS